jgi:hypothetical protein
MKNRLPLFGKGVCAFVTSWIYVLASSVCGQFFDCSGSIWFAGCLTIVTGATVAALMHGDTTNINNKKKKIFSRTRPVIHKDTQDYLPLIMEIAFKKSRRNDHEAITKILLTNLFNYLPKQIDHFLLNDPDLFNFFTCSPMSSFPDKRKPLSAVT